MVQMKEQVKTPEKELNDEEIVTEKTRVQENEERLRNF